MQEKPTRRSFLKGAGVALSGLALTTQTVSAESSSDRYIVDLRNTSDGVLDGLDVVHDISQIDLAVVKGDEAQVSGLRHSKDVEMELNQAEKEHNGNGDEPAPHSLSQLQWDKQAQSVNGVHGTTRGDGTRVSVIDSGALETHPNIAPALNTDLSKNFTGDGGDYNPVISDHGTHVSGIIAADDTNDDGVYGTAPATDLVALRVFTGPLATFGDIIAAMVYAGDIDSDAANMSIGVYPLPNDADTQLLKESIERATDYGNEQGTLYVAAAGNDGTNLDTDGDVISLPNEADNVMSISATGPIGYRWNDPGNGRRIRNYHAAFNHLDEPTTEPAYYTNYGAEAIDISAEGGNAVASEPEGENWQYDLVLSTVFEWGDSGMVPAYGWKGGTSMAAPQVSAAAALVKSLNPDATPGEIRAHLESTARDLGQPTYSGEGHLDVSAAVREEL